MTSAEFCRRLLASTVLLGLATPAFAQASDETTAASDDTIVVTGSRIARPDLQQASPISIVSAQELKLSGKANVEAIINDLPQLIPSTTAASNNPGGGVSTADLRGLGAQRTLVLVDGHRYVSYDSNQVVDLNTVPAGLIDHVEVVSGGRSAVYGSDAIAGVINFVMKKNFSGVEANANYRLNEEGDGGTFNTNILLGQNFADGRGNITLYADYIKRNGVDQSARSYTSQTYTDDGEGNLVAGGSGSIPATRMALNNSQYKFNQDGSYSAYSAATDAYNYAPSNYLQVPQKRILLSGQAHFDVSDHLTLYGEGQFIRNKVRNKLAPTPFTGTVDIDTDSSFLSADSQALLAAADTDGDGYTSANIYRRLTEVGDRISNVDNTAYRALIGAKGNISGEWNYDAYYSYSRTKQVETQYGNVSRSRVEQALKTTYDADGNLVCSDISNGCVPLNIFGAGNISDEAADFISITTRNVSYITEQVANAAITNGNLFDLGAGPAGIAFGAEYRSEKGSYNPDEALSSGDVVGFNAGQGLGGSYNVKELFTEISVPLLADLPLVHKLDFNGAYRFSHYSTAAKNVSTFSLGLIYAPIKDITFRGQYSRAVRAPSVYELYSGQSQDFPTATDPCSTSAATTSATLSASCLASGVSSSALGTDFYGGSSQIESLTGGNPDLREETSNTWGLGVVLQPGFAPRLSLTVDYYNIKIDDYISTAGTANIIRACYGDEANGWTPYDSSYCSLLPRNATSSEIEGAVNLQSNTGGLKTSGVDFELNYSVPLNFGLFGAKTGKLAFRVAGTRLIRYDLNPVAAIAELNQSCAGKFGVNCGDPYSKLRLNNRITWTSGPITLGVTHRYLSSVRDDDDTTSYTVEKIKAYNLFDLALQVQPTERFGWSIGMNNVFDKTPPVLGDNQQQANSYPSTYDVYGRAFFVNASVKF
ncbi:TonB-dependent receptor [Sphingobium sp. Leaf26]|uniref:TonB-dependent receptor n=1 Tax=Sphingobium sp. Leaf26 TaxID=1735693 RepID=UPI0006F2D590|nr:TonB-dependent receptor [Sphingobium sp. Leaf26]KQN00761.1 TonB-dependent receptor [Sphingobium sp. Leaf26]